MLPKAGQVVNYAGSSGPCKARDTGTRTAAATRNRWNRPSATTVISHRYSPSPAGREGFRVRGTISRMEQRLDPARFVRVKRSEIVHVTRIANLEPYVHGGRIVVLTDGTKTRLSRRYRDRLDHFGP